MVATIAILTLGPFQGAERKVNFTDKEAHVFAFGLLTALATLALPTVKGWHVAVICVAFGGFVEVAQIPAGRSADFIDWAADIAGAAIGYSLIMAWRIVSKLLHRRCTYKSGDL